MIVKTIHDECTEEILRIMRTYEARAQVHPDENMLPLKLAMNEELLAACKKHQRVLSFKAGKPVAPEAHTAVVVLTPKGGMAG